jgi:hypothetical protein
VWSSVGVIPLSFFAEPERATLSRNSQDAHQVRADAETSEPAASRTSVEGARTGGIACWPLGRACSYEWVIRLKYRAAGGCQGWREGGRTKLPSGHPPHITKRQSISDLFGFLLTTG